MIELMRILDCNLMCVFDNSISGNTESGGEKNELK
jgi:hypothetical protein